MSTFRAALVALLACAALTSFAAGGADRLGASLPSHADGKGTTTFWGQGAHYEITGPGVTVFFLRRDDGTRVFPLIRVAYVGEGWINVRSVTFTVGERTYGPYSDAFGQPARIETKDALFVESLIFNVDSDEKWRMLEGIAEASELGRPVIAVLDADAPYGIELDRSAKSATSEVVRGFR